MENATPPQAPTKVLVVDDSEIVLEQVEMTLEDAGYEVATLSSIFKLHRALKSMHPDVVLLDVKMPNVSDDTSASILKEYSSTEKILVLLHSDLSELELRDLTRRTGIGGFIRKSMGSEDLVEKLEEALAQSRDA